jgi:signal transduction histidine kinase
MTDPVLSDPQVSSSDSADRSPADFAVSPAAPSSAEQILRICSELNQYQLRNVAAEVVAALAHALGTPLNVISGRAELIRQDPANAAAQVARIEDQVRKVAAGLRQLVDYLSVDESALTSVPVRDILDEAVWLMKPAAERAGVLLSSDGAAVGSTCLERLHVLGVLSSLAGMAITATAEPSVPSSDRRVHIRGSTTDGWVTVELDVPGLPLREGWHLEHFQPRPPADRINEAYQVLSVCAALVRGRGGKLAIEQAPEPSDRGSGGCIVRCSYRVGSA